MPLVAVTLAALAADMFAMLAMLTGFALGTFTALTFLVLAPVVVDPYHVIWHAHTGGRDLNSRCWRAR